MAAAVQATTYMSRQVFPQAPSPTITSFRRISAMVLDVMGFWMQLLSRGSVKMQVVSSADGVDWR